MKSTTNIVSLIFNEYLIIRAERITIEMEKINGFGYGTFYQELIHPAHSLLVKREEKNYTAINYEDQRLSSYLEKYNKSTKIEVLVINNNDIEKIHFIANELVPQITSTRKFSEFFKSIITNTQYQIWIRDFFAIKPNKNDSTLKFNTTSFSECFGANSPSLSTLNKIKEKSAKKREQFFSTNPIQTNRLGNRNTTGTRPINNHTKNHESTYEELNYKWNTFIGSKHSYDHAVKIASNQNSSSFIERLDKGLKEYKPGSRDFMKFAKDLEVFLDKESSSEQ